MRRLADHHSPITTHAPTYWDRTQRPLHSLYFLLPVLVLYHVGTAVYAPLGHDRLPPIVAERVLGHFFHVFGVTGYYLPGLIVSVVLLCWHAARRDPWCPELRLYPLMWIESIVLAVPLFVFMVILFRGEQTVQWSVPLAGNGAATGLQTWQVGVVFSIGAGIYEELMFRLIAIALLHLLLVDVLALPKSYGAAGSVVLSAIAFSLYHFDTLEAIDPVRSLFFTIAGVYFAVIYVLRGFGIVVAIHVIYDVMAVTLRVLQSS